MIKTLQLILLRSTRNDACAWLKCSLSHCAKSYEYHRGGKVDRLNPVRLESIIIWTVSVNKTCMERKYSSIGHLNICKILHQTESQIASISSFLIFNYFMPTASCITLCPVMCRRTMVRWILSITEMINWDRIRIHNLHVHCLQPFSVWPYAKEFFGGHF